ncbi:YggT family protein [Sphingomonas flavalba]|uniref:YggT family protein n=1 Tax=Sphingomonas flavalba TaxID=2559804 RepID=UPI00109E29AA|nr:YggT family protein [Sphingomonas flavalba]
MLLSLYQILQILLSAAQWIIIIQAILSWLVAFNVINTYNEVIRSVLIALDRLTEPLYRPIRKIMPDLGALDLSPLVVLLVIYILRSVILPNIFTPLLIG